MKYDCGKFMDEPDRGKRKYLEKTYSNDLSSTTDSSLTGLGLNLEIQNKRALTE
jgi:hypothetical protein